MGQAGAPRDIQWAARPGEDVQATRTVGTTPNDQEEMGQSNANTLPRVLRRLRGPLGPQGRAGDAYVSAVIRRNPGLKVKPARRAHAAFR
jgi:hypothetical protein